MVHNESSQQQTATDKNKAKALINKQMNIENKIVITIKPVDSINE